MAVSREERLRQKKLRVDYKEFSDVKLPKAQRTKRCRAMTDRLYPVEIIEEDAHRYKVHYVGYSNTYDEWKPKEELVPLELEQTEGESDEESFGEGNSAIIVTQRFTLYQELATRIKTSLNAHRKASPVVKIDMPFDQIEFDGGLRICGRVKKCVLS